MSGTSNDSSQLIRTLLGIHRNLPLLMDDVDTTLTITANAITETWIQQR
jgi:hypothetical protein